MADREKERFYLNHLYTPPEIKQGNIKIRTERLVSPVLVVPPVRVLHFDSGGKLVFRQDTGVHFVLDDGTVIANAVQPGEFRVETDTYGYVLSERLVLEGEAPLRAWNRLGYKPDRLKYVIKTHDVQGYNPVTKQMTAQRYLQEYGIFPGDRPKDIFRSAQKILFELWAIRRPHVITLDTGTEIVLHPETPTPEDWFHIEFKPIRFRAGMVPVLSDDDRADDYDYEINIYYTVGPGWLDEKEKWLAQLIWRYPPDSTGYRSTADTFLVGDRLRELVQDTVNQGEKKVATSGVLNSPRF